MWWSLTWSQAPADTVKRLIPDAVFCNLKFRGFGVQVLAIQVQSILSIVCTEHIYMRSSALNSSIGGLCNSFRSYEILESCSNKKVSYLQIVLPVWIMVVTSSIWWAQQNYPQVNRCFRRLHPTNKQTLQKTASDCHHLRPFVMVTGGSGSACWTWICWRKTSQNLQSQNGKILSRTEGNKSQYRCRWFIELAASSWDCSIVAEIPSWKSEGNLYFVTVTFLKNGPKSQDRVCVEKQREMWCTALIFSFFL